MQAKRIFEYNGAAAAILAGVLWIMSAWFQRTPAPPIGAAYDFSTPEEIARLRDVQRAGTFNFYSAMAAALAGFAQGAALLIRPKS